MRRGIRVRLPPSYPYQIIECTGILLDGCSDVTIKNNRVECNYLDNPDLGMEKEEYVNEVCGIYLKNSDNNILSKNTVKDINMRGIDFYSSEAYGIYIDSSSNDNVISNCTIEGNYIGSDIQSWDLKAYGICLQGNNNVVVNNIITDTKVTCGGNSGDDYAYGIYIGGEEDYSKA
ncbi:MAG: hypothetical protein DRP01_06150 [Archaeoglobales archaeon]|nr:MAG: hypothetical protein DRP01_06150 [Archaeoglobales archaeon]